MDGFLPRFDWYTQSPPFPRGNTWVLGLSNSLDPFPCRWDGEWYWLLQGIHQFDSLVELVQVVGTRNEVNIYIFIIITILFLRIGSLHIYPFLQITLLFFHVTYIRILQNIPIQLVCLPHIHIAFLQYRSRRRCCHSLFFHRRGWSAMN